MKQKYSINRKHLYICCVPIILKEKYMFNKNCRKKKRYVMLCFYFYFVFKKKKQHPYLQNISSAGEIYYNISTVKCFLNSQGYRVK